MVYQSNLKMKVVLLAGQSRTLFQQQEKCHPLQETIESHKLLIKAGMVAWYLQGVLHPPTASN